MKRTLANPLVGPLAARVARRQISLYERRLPLLWSLYAHIPEANRGEEATPGGQERLTNAYYRYLARHIPTLPLQPKFSVLVPVYQPNPEFLRQALRSVVIQTYANWELCVADDHSDDPVVHGVLKEFAELLGDRMKLRLLPRNEGIAGASNEALEMAAGDYCSLLDHDDRLYPNAFSELVRQINLAAAEDRPLPDFLYTDERVIGEHGELLNDPFYKPDWSPLMHLSVNYTTHLSTYRTELLRHIGGFRAGFDGSQDHDLSLRAAEATTAIEHVPMVLYQWRAHSQSTAHSLDAKPAAAGAGVRAVKEACERRGFPAHVSFDSSTGHYRISYEIPDPRPLVSIVIPTKNGEELLKRCIKSIDAVTTYENYELILVDNGSDEEGARTYLAELDEREDVRVITDPGYFNFARLCNQGVRAAAGKYVLLLNNDTEVLTPGWLEAMVGVAQWPSVGAVGAKLLYEDRKVQHAGVVGLADVIAGHSGRGRSSDDPMYAHLINTMHETMAVTGACLLVARGKYWEVGGLDEAWVPNAYGDVDLCLKLRGANYANVYTPYAVLLHVESPSRKANIETFERVRMRHKWAADLLTDPYVNPNLLRSETYAIDHRFRQPELPATLFNALLRPGAHLPWL